MAFQLFEIQPLGISHTTPRPGLCSSKVLQRKIVAPILGQPFHGIKSQMWHIWHIHMNNYEYIDQSNHPLTGRAEMLRTKKVPSNPSGYSCTWHSNTVYFSTRWGGGADRVTQRGAESAAASRKSPRKIWDVPRTNWWHLGHGAAVTPIQSNFGEKTNPYHKKFGWSFWIIAMGSPKAILGALPLLYCTKKTDGKPPAVLL